MAARKATRGFKQMEGDFEPKSSLDGSRELVIPEPAYPQNTDNEADAGEKIRNFIKTMAHDRENVYPVFDLLKRLGGKVRSPKFRSTSHLAAIPFLEKLEDSDRQSMVAEIKQMFKDAGWEIEERDDGALLYQGRLSEWVPASQQEALRNGLEKILGNYAGKQRPSPYYALLAADGDNMGVVIDAQKDPKKHRELSNVLSLFALEVLQIVEKHQGVPIYSGGDDILAYCPLHTVLSCITELEEVFKDKLKSFKGYDKVGQEIFPTLSIGLVVAHHLTSLSDVLEMARNAEKEAKEVDGKNGLAVTISKRSGVERTIRGKWSDLSKRLESLIDFSQKDAISTGTAYELQQLHRDLAPTAIPVEGIVGEALRIISRKQEFGGEQKIAPEVKSVFTDWISEDRISVDELAKEMIVAQMFTSAGEVADDLNSGERGGDIMSLWLLVPRDPLIFRDGKPFTAVPGERAKSLRYPYPSTVAGAVRTLAGTDPDSGDFDSAQIQELLRLSIRGPLLVELDKSGKINDWLFPAPADALLLKGDSEEQAIRHWLAPVEMPDGCESDLDGLALVGPAKILKEKSHSNPPYYWRQEQFLHWLDTPQDGPVALDELGVRGPQHESLDACEHCSRNAIGFAWCIVPNQRSGIHPT